MTTSRRTLLQGTAWAAPAVLATTVIPAYAASTSATVVATGFTEVFEFQAANSTDPEPFTGTTNRDDEGGFGFYVTNSGQATVELFSLTYYLLIPRKSDYTIQSAMLHYGVIDPKTWSEMQLSTAATVALADGSVASASDYYIYTTSFTVIPQTVIATGQAVAINETVISTNIVGEFTASDGLLKASEISGVLTGYIASYSVNGGPVTSSSTVASSTKTS